MDLSISVEIIQCILVILLRQAHQFSHFRFNSNCVDVTCRYLCKIMLLMSLLQKLYQYINWCRKVDSLPLQVPCFEQPETEMII